MQQKYTYCFLLVLFLISHLSLAQKTSTKQQKMEQLSFMTGEWVGTSTLYENGAVSKQVPAFQHIAYDLNKSILVIKLNSELLKLHTIIYYNEQENTYYYHPFSENGARKLPAEYKDERFVVHANEHKRFVFERTGTNSFREYGEKQVDGVWIKYFEDQFVASK